MKITHTRSYTLTDISQTELEIISHGLAHFVRILEEEHNKTVRDLPFWIERKSLATSMRMSIDREMFKSGAVKSWE